MSYNTTLNFNDFNKLIFNIEGMIALSDVSSEEWKEVKNSIDKIKEIWNKKNRKEFGNVKSKN